MKQLLVDADDYVGRWVAAKAELQFHPGFDVTLGLLDSSQGLLAGVLYRNFNGANIEAHIAAQPGANWLTREFLWAMFDYPFNQLGVQRITGLVPAKNLAARRFDEHLGFVIEATLEGALPGDDLIVYRLRREDCRWLSLKGHRNGQEIIHTENA